MLELQTTQAAFRQKGGWLMYALCTHKCTYIYIFTYIDMHTPNIYTAPMFPLRDKGLISTVYIYIFG